MLRKFFASICLVTFGILFAASILSQMDGYFPLACLYSFGSAPYLWFALLLLLDNK